MALTQFGVSENESLFITDTLGDMREAANAGLKSIGVSWGFQRRETLLKGDPHAIVDTPEELFSVLTKSI